MKRKLVCTVAYKSRVGFETHYSQIQLLKLSALKYVFHDQLYLSLLKTDYLTILEEGKKNLHMVHFTWIFLESARLKY